MSLKKIISIGTTTQNNKLVNGQSMMFQLFVDKIKTIGIEPCIVDFGVSVDKNFGNTRVSGKFNFTKLIDNILLSVKLFFTLISNPKAPVYINTSQSKVGFIRDFIFINMAKLFKRKVIAHQFGANYEGFYNSQSPFIQKKIKSTIEKTDYFIVEGDYTKKQFSFVKEYENKVVSIPNGLPQEVNSDNIKPKDISEPIVILYLSNMIEGKGFWDVLEAGNLLQNKYNKNIKLIFAGRFLEDLEDTLCKTSEEARDLFSKKLKEYNLLDKTVYYEGLYEKQKEEAFRKAHFFILPSYYINEGQPVSVLEAIAYGCVPIVTEYRLIPSMVNNENGFFVNPKSPEEIAEKILESNNSPEMYREKSEKGIAFYKQNFTAEKYVSQILKLF